MCQSLLHVNLIPLRTATSPALDHYMLRRADTVKNNSSLLNFDFQIRLQLVCVCGKMLYKQAKAFQY